MGSVFGRWGAKHSRLAEFGYRALEPVGRLGAAKWGLVGSDSRVAQSRLALLAEAMREGREAYVLGVGFATHNSGASLVRVSPDGTLELVCNEEEERYTGIKHCSDYPEHSVEAIKVRLSRLGISPTELAAVVNNWDFPKLMATLVRGAIEEAPRSLTADFDEQPGQPIQNDIFPQVRSGATRLARQLGHERRMPVIAMRHHDSHAHVSYALSPFAHEPGPTMVLVLDGSGDDASASFYVAQESRLRLLAAHGSNILDSLGALYGFLSATQGGWPVLSSEGRYMGAAAWGNGNRLTNRHYRRLRQIVYFGSDGEVRINRALANWMRRGLAEPYTDELIGILGEPIPPEQMWHPDAVLNVEDVRHPEVTQERVDKAAALQMVFEDGLVHIVEHLIRATGGDRLVLCGGTALNCVANMRLLDSFDEHWYQRELGRSDTRLHLWVPPTPGDAGTPAGAAFAFAMRAGARVGKPMRHAFYCGIAPSEDEIVSALEAEASVGRMQLGDCADPRNRERIADLLAHALAEDRIFGLYQGASETGPRALGHRSILANPCNPETRRLLNERVKHRELIRPLAPMLTRAAAETLFELQPGATDDDYNAYSYMILTARARPHAKELIPAVVHHDGTGRLQIVNPEVDPLCHAFLVAMGRRVGVEASVNTSLNVGAPIAHTPTQAVETLKRAKGMDGLLMIGAEQQATLVWIEGRSNRLSDSIERWQDETGLQLGRQHTPAP